MKKFTYGSVTNAVKQYPTLKQTVTLAKEFGVKIVGHGAQLTRKGKVCCHWWLAHTDFDKKDEWQRNQDLLNWLKNCKELRKCSLKEK